MAEPITLQECSTILFDRAKRWWVGTNVLRLGTVAFSVSATILKVSPLTTALLAALLALGAWWTQYKTDAARDQSNDLRRQIDLREGLGWPVSPLFLADLSATTHLQVSPGVPPESYFESTTNPSPERLVENVRETGFFSEHLAATAERSMWWVTAALVLTTVFGLFAALDLVDDLETLRTLGVVLASVLLAVEATGVARLALDYRGFRQAACEAKSDAHRLLSGGTVAMTEAVHTAETYYMSRARAPLIPSWVYSRRRDELNRLWRQSYGAPH